MEQCLGNWGSRQWKERVLTVVSISPTSARALRAAGIRLGFVGVRGSTRGPYMPIISWSDRGDKPRACAEEVPETGPMYTSCVWGSPKLEDHPSSPPTQSDLTAESFRSSQAHWIFPKTQSSKRASDCPDSGALGHCVGTAPSHRHHPHEPLASQDKWLDICLPQMEDWLIKMGNEQFNVYPLPTWKCEKAMHLARGGLSFLPWSKGVWKNPGQQITLCLWHIWGCALSFSWDPFRDLGVCTHLSLPAMKPRPFLGLNWVLKEKQACTSWTTRLRENRTLCSNWK